MKGDKLVDERGTPMVLVEILDDKGFQLGKDDEKPANVLKLEKDQEKAFNFFKAAAKLGHVEAAFQAAQLEVSKARSGSSPFALQSCQVRWGGGRLPVRPAPRAMPSSCPSRRASTSPGMAER